MFELISLALLIAVIVLFFGQSKLKKRMRGLEAALGDLGKPAAPKAAKAEKRTPDDAVSKGELTGPWAKAKGAKLAPTLPLAADKTPKGPPKRFVFKPGALASAGTWLVKNWFLAVAALSLALAGVFLVQYGVENGLLSPFWRVMGAAFFGVALIWGGEFIRRRSGDGADSHTAYLPSTFAGAGLVALFAAVLSARQLYGLIGAEAALVYLVMVSGVAVALGWYYGPFLAVVGILGSVAAPFLIGGESDAPELFYYYFALIVAAALLVDAIKRWAWVSALALILSFAAAFTIYTMGAAGEHFLAFGLLTSIAAITLPRLSVWPSHIGATVSRGLMAGLRLSGKTKAAAGWPEFPTRVAAGAFAGASAIAMLVALDDAGSAEVWLAIFALCILFVMAALWCRGAPALADLAVLPAALFLGIIAAQSFDYGSLYAEFRLGVSRPPETGPPWTVTAFITIGLAGSALAHWRGLFEGAKANFWSAGAAVLAPLTLVALEFIWAPEPVLGAARWAAHAIIIAAVMVLFAGQVARRDGADKRRVAYFALAALVMIAFALVIVLSSAALTLALAVMVLGAAVIDQRLDLKLLNVFVQIGVIVIGWRLVLDPGVFWALNAPKWEVALAYLGSAALIYAAWIALAERGRSNARLTVESGIWATLGVFASVMLSRALEATDAAGHLGFSLFGSIWLMLMFVQLYRLRAGGVLRWVRIGLAIIYGWLAFAFFGAMSVFGNPLQGGGNAVVGPPLFDSLLVAFGVPALVLAIGVWKLPELSRFLRVGFVAMSGLFVALYVGLEIRRLWQGRDLSVPGVLDGELYSYTIALLLASVGLLFFAFNRRSVPLRQIATVGIGLTIAKVFLIDMAGLAGLLRVASFLGLGLSLAGLGWIYRRMSDQWDAGKPGSQ